MLDCMLECMPTSDTDLHYSYEILNEIDVMSGENFLNYNYDCKWVELTAISTEIYELKIEC